MKTHLLGVRPRHARPVRLRRCLHVLPAQCTGCTRRVPRGRIGADFMDVFRVEIRRGNDESNSSAQHVEDVHRRRVRPPVASIVVVVGSEAVAVLAAVGSTRPRRVHGAVSVVIRVHGLVRGRAVRGLIRPDNSGTREWTRGRRRGRLGDVPDGIVRVRERVGDGGGLHVVHRVPGANQMLLRHQHLDASFAKFLEKVSRRRRGHVTYEPRVTGNLHGSQ